MDAYTREFTLKTADAAELFIRFGTVEPLFHEKSLLSSFLQGKV